VTHKIIKTLPGKPNISNFLNKIFCNDSVKLLQKMPHESVDLVVTSPPYDDLRDYKKSNNSWDFKKFQNIAKNLFRVMKKGGVIVWVVGDKVNKGNKSLTSFKHALYFQELGFNIYDVIIYEKTGSGPPHPGRYFNSFEYMFIVSKGKPKTINILKDKKNKWAGLMTFGNVSRREKDGALTNKGRKKINEFGVRTNIWKYTNGKGFSTKDEIAYEHPAIFPEKLAMDHIYCWSNEGDIVLDIFGGSGTTIKVAKIMNRKWIYFDQVEKYCEITTKRLCDEQ
jgi:site-specific DNA-methyltransferase (adenine-specific)